LYDGIFTNLVFLDILDNCFNGVSRANAEFAINKLIIIIKVFS